MIARPPTVAAPPAAIAMLVTVNVPVAASVRVPFVAYRSDGLVIDPVNVRARHCQLLVPSMKFLMVVKKS